MIEDANHFTLTLTLPHQGGGNFELFPSFPRPTPRSASFPIMTPPRSQVALGNATVAKLSLAGKGIPKPGLRARKTSPLRFVHRANYKLNRLKNREHKFM